MRFLYKRLFIFLFPFVFFSDSLFSQSYWMLKGGGVTADEGIDICIDNSGNTFTTGYFTGIAKFGSLTMSSSGTSDIFIVKTNSNGTVLWAKSAGGFGPDKGLSIKTDVNGNCYVTGFFYGTANFSGTQVSSSGGSQDMFLAKYDASGNFLWVEIGGGKMGDMGNAVTTDRYGNVYITGQFKDTAQFSGTTLISMLDTNFQSSIDAFIAKYNSNGNLLWIKKGSAVYTDRGMDIVTDTLGNVYALGQFSDTISFDNTYNNNSYNATYLLKCDSMGTELWFRRMGGSSQNIAYGLAIDNNSNLFITGDCSGNIIFFGPTNYPFTAPYNYNVYVAKYNTNGDFLWFTSEGSSSQISSRNIALDQNGNPFIIGNFRCVFSQYSDFFGAGTFNSIGFRDVFVTKYNSSGTRQWMRQCGGQKDDFGSGIAINSLGKPIITGSYRYKMIFPGLLNFIWSTIDGYASPACWSNYCSGPNYDDYYFLDSIGNSDVFIANAIDSSRQTYDYYKRIGTGCNRDYVGCCINNTVAENSCASDSIEVCDYQYLYAASNTSSSSNFQVNWGNFVNYSSPGPIFNYLWSTGDTTRSLYVNTTGTYSVTITSIDSCFQSSDTIYVAVHPSPLKPSISDDVVVNTNSYNPLPITLCAPDSVILTGGSVGNNYYYWTGPGLPGTGLNQLSITVNISGSYYLFVADSFGCFNYNSVNVNLIPFPPIAPKIFCDDSVTICEGDPFGICIYDSLTQPPGCFYIPNSTITINVTPGNSFYPASSGTYQIFATIIRNTICGSDTYYLDTSIYVTVIPVANITVSVSGNTLMCPGGDTITLTAISNSNIFQWYGPGIITNPNSNMIDINQSGFYYVTVSDTSSACVNTAYQFVSVSNKPQPTVSKNPPNGLICPGDSVTMTVNLSGISYQWFGPDGLISGAITQSHTDSITGFYFCVVMDADTCELVSNSVELKHYATPFLIVTPATTICPGGSATLEVITNDGSLLSWWAPLSGNQLIKTVYSAGTYTCSVTSCNITTVVNTEITEANPLAQITLSDSASQCEGDSVILFANSGSAGYEWSDGSSNSILVIYQSGSFSLTTTDNNGCTAVSSPVNIAFLQSPAPPLVSSDTTICYLDSVTLLASAIDAVNWFDTVSGGILIASGNSFSTTSILATTTFFAQTVNSVCNSIRVPVTVFVDSASLIPVVYSNSPVCIGDTICIFSNYITGANYLWNGPGGFSSNQQNIVIDIAANADSGNYILVISSQACSSPPESLDIAVITLPPVPDIFSNSPLCEGDTLFLTSDSISMVNYNWYGPNNFFSDQINPLIYNVSMLDSGVYHLYISDSACISEEKTILISVFETPDISGIGNNSPFCSGDSLILFVDSINSANYFWFGPDSYFSSLQNPVIINASELFSGQYSLFAILGNCKSDTQKTEVIIFPLPTVNLGNDTVICNNSFVVLNPDSGYADYLWQNNYSAESLIVSDEGDYFVMVTDTNGCFSTDTISILLKDCEVPMPRIFTPNGDGVNDNFMIIGTGLKNLHVIIFNRWGQKIFEWNGNDGFWDGKTHPDGEPASEGVYYYVVEFTDFYDSNQKHNGYFHLYR